jgi:hypothetical protein
MKRETLIANYVNTISWFDKTIVDWALGGNQYLSDGTIKQLRKYHFAFNFDGAITSVDGKYQFIYKRFGTKGLLLKDGEILREINRSYYCANVYEYPAAFVTRKNVIYLIHCPITYNQLDFENVETGELITNITGRKPSDVFHSRLEISPNNSCLISKGWFWHPLDVIEVFNIEDCFNNPSLLDKFTLYPGIGVEVCTASFINDAKILIGSSDEIVDDDNLEKLPPNHITIWDLETDQLSKPLSINAEFGNLFAINENFAWDLFNYPKIININTGEVIDKNEEFNSGQQRSSIIRQLDTPPQIIFNQETKQIAISGKDKIEVFTPDASIVC